jgi:hypothetical protein
VIMTTACMACRGVSVMLERRCRGGKSARDRRVGVREHRENVAT